MAAQFLDEFARELDDIGERAFRRRHAAPVLIVSGRRARARKPEAVRALVSRVFPLIKAPGSVGPVVVGRVLAAGVDVVIADPSISKRHCLFAPDDGMLTVSDCASTNGTAVNGAPLRGGAAVRLCGGELITLGRLEVTFETPAGFTELVSELGSK